jgi:uncharacterized phiE125 gp8 family phage protein
MERRIFLSVPPAVEPVTLEEALVHCHADASLIDGGWFLSRIKAGREKVETRTRRSLITQTWVLRYDNGAPAVVDLPRSPVQKIKSIRVDGVQIALKNVRIIIEGSPARVILPNAPISSLRIVYVAGYGDDGSKVPEPLKDAILLYVAHCYDNRASEKELPRAFYDLIEPYRLWV